MYHGDFQKAGTIYLYFNTIGTTGEAATISSGVITAYEDGSGTQFTSGITFDNDFDSVTGFHQIIIDLTDANFEAGKTYTLILSAGTVGALSVVGRIVGSFSVGRYGSFDDVLAYPTAILSSTPSIAEALGFLAWLPQAKATVTGSLLQVFAADGTTVIFEKTLSDDDTTFTAAAGEAP